MNDFNEGSWKNSEIARLYFEVLAAEEFSEKVVAPPIKVMIQDPRPSGINSKQMFENLEEAFAWAKNYMEPLKNLMISVSPTAYEEMPDGSIIDRYWYSRDGEPFQEAVEHHWKDPKDGINYAERLGVKIVPYLGDFRDIVKNAASDTGALIATDAEKDEDGGVEVELKADPQPKVELELVRAEFASWEAQQALIRLASQAAKNGNVRAAYLIERAIQDIDKE